MTDPKSLWREQLSDAHDVRLENLQADVRAELNRIRRARILLVLSALAGAGLTGRLAFSAPTELLRLGEGLMAAGFLLVLALGWRRLTRGAPDAAETCLAYLRRSLVRRREAVLGGWIALVAPLLPGLWLTFIGLAAASGGQWLKLMPVVALLALWIAIMMLLLMRESAKVAAEIARLDRL